MLGSLYVDAFVCSVCERVYFVKARSGVDQFECKDCSRIIRDDESAFSPDMVVRDIELWCK